MRLPLFTLPLLAATVLADQPQGIADFMSRHCTDCHDADVKKGGLDLTALGWDLADGSAFEKWGRVMERVRDGEMPPKKKPQPEPADKTAFLSALKAPLFSADKADIAARGRVRGRRLTRVEYDHTLHDLLGIDRPLKTLLPEDRISHGFETVADGQQLSQHQLARYLDVADLALDEAFDRALEGDKTFKKFYTPKDLAKKTRGNYRGPDLKEGKSISWPITLQFFGRMNATSVPEDGWYRITLRQVEAINPSDAGVVWGTLRSGTCYSDAPMLYMVGLVEATKEPRDLTFEAWMQEDHMLELRPNDGTQKKAPTGAKGGNVSFDGRNLAKQGFQGILHTGIQIERIYPYASSVEVRKRLFGSHELVKENVPTIIKDFAARAFRRPVTNEQVAAYQGIAQGLLKEGGTVPDALRAAYRAILCSPRFLSFIEAPGPLDDHALATRLSYALWTSMPDEELITLADQGKLKEPVTLSAQIDRMLDDPKAERFIASFTDQWLKLNQIDFTSPDTRLFKTFDPVLQESMLQETRLYVSDLIKSDRSIAAFVDSGYTYLNERLARHYEEKVSLTPGAGLQRVKLVDGSVRGGLVAQGAILKVTADGTHTSPVVRGVFVNERILGERIPPPPPGVPAIEPDIRGAVSIRDQLDKHRNNESCASCHQTIDPPGFALENFDPVGLWRVNYGKGDKGARVDPSGRTPDGAPFADLRAWQKIYGQRKQQLARGFVAQFLTYATGSPIRLSDEPTLDKLATEPPTIRQLLKASMLSEVFMKK